MDKLSIIVPCYNEEESLPIFYEEITKIAKQMDQQIFEFVFIDDGSKDNTLKILRELANKDERVRFISFARNFGKEAGMYAGLQAVTGDYVAVMDVDLQDPPTLLPEMYNTLKFEDFDCVATKRSTRAGEPPIRSWFAHRFYEIINKISSANIVDGARDYRLMRRSMVNAILSMSEYNRFSKGIFGWVGFKIKWLSYENIERVAGVTKWSFWKLFKYAIDGIVAFSVAPLMIPLVIGCLICGICLIVMLVDLINYGVISGVTLLSFLIGLQIACLGIVALYFSKSYLEIQKRPIYIVRENEKGILKE